MTRAWFESLEKRGLLRMPSGRFQKRRRQGLFALPCYRTPGENPLCLKLRMLPYTA